MKIEVTVNGIPVTRTIPPNRRLIDFLRYDLLLTGTKEGCGEGECGACTVLLDGRPVNSCLLLAAQAQGCEVITIEGVRETAIGSRLISAFAELGAIQCGFCTPGLIMAVYPGIAQQKLATRADIKQAIAGNLCRCTGYQKVVAAVEQVIDSPQHD